MSNNTVYVILSTHVDSTIRENMPDVNFILFRTISELETYIATQPLRADIFYFTAETLRPTETSGLNKLRNVFTNTFFNTKSIQLICEESFSTRLILDLNKQLPINIEINKGVLQRSFIYTLIEGTLATDDITEQHVVNLRMSKQKYIEFNKRREALQEKTQEELELLEEKYVSDEELLKDIPEEAEFIALIPKTESNIETINVCGLDIKERRVFTYLLAQYVSLKGKTIFFESDYQYLELSDIVSRSSLEILMVKLSDLIMNTEETLVIIANTMKSLIFVYSDSKEVLSYDFIYNLLSINLNGHVRYILAERNMNELSVDQDHIIVFPSTIPDLLKTLDVMEVAVKPSTRFVALEMISVKEMCLINEEVMTRVIKEITSSSLSLPVMIFKITSLILGGEVHDLQMLFKNR